MSKIKIFALAVITSLVLVTLRVGSISSQAQDSTKKYTDSEFGIALDYPYDWSITNTINNPQNTDPFIIQKRITLSNNINALTQFNVDIWRNFEGLSTQDWFDKYEKRFHNNTANLINGKDITISNIPAVLIFEEAQNQAHGRITMIVSTQDLVVRLDYYTNEGGLFQSEFVDIAKSIAFTQQQPVVNSQGVATNFPDAPFIGLNKATLQGAPCCGWVDPNPNTYPCSGGNCTWWAKYKRPDIGNVWGTAWEWRDRARQVGFSVGYTAHVGAIAVWQANISSGGGWSADIVAGHVAYVESVESNGWFWVSSMSWGGSCTTGNSGVSSLHAHESGNENVTFIYGNGVHTGNDYNGDGKPDLYAIAKTGGGSGKTDLYVLNGADNYQSYLLATATLLGYTDGPAWVFNIGDYNGDGKPDLYAIAKTGGGSGKTDLYVLNGADNYQSYLLATATLLGYTDGPTWAFSIGDYNGDGKPDLYAIAKTGGGSGKTDVYILNGADNYQSYLLATATVLGYSPVCDWDFATGEAACVVASVTPSPTLSTTVTPSPTSMTPSPTPSTTVTPSPTSMTPSPTPSTTVTPSPTSMTPSPTPSTTVTSSPMSMTPSPTPSTTVTPSPTSVTSSPTPITSHYSVYLPMIQR